MKKLTGMLLLLGALNLPAQDFTEATGVTTLSPLIFASLIVDSFTATAQQVTAGTSARVQDRGIAGREQLRDELLKLNEEMMAGKVRTIEDVKQPALKELFLEISVDEAQMEEITELVKNGTQLQRIATAVAVALMIQI
jgi:hypothetical protein